MVHDELVEADQYDADGNATVTDADIRQSLKAAGIDKAPDLVEVDAIELYGQPPYSGFVDDPICLANGNFLLREGDLPVFGTAAPLSVIRAYNSRDPRGPAHWSGTDVARRHQPPHRGAPCFVPGTRRRRLGVLAST